MHEKDANSFPPDMRKIIGADAANLGDPRRVIFPSNPFELSHPLDYRYERIRGFAMIQLRHYDVDSFLAAVSSAELKEVVHSDDRIRLDRAIYRFKDLASARRMGDLIEDYLQANGSTVHVSIEP